MMFFARQTQNDETAMSSGQVNVSRDEGRDDAMLGARESEMGVWIHFIK